MSDAGQHDREAAPSGQASGGDAGGRQDESHDAPIKEAWSGVGDSFTALGRLMRERYRGEHAAGGAEAGSAAQAGPGDTGAGDTGAADAVRRAFEQVTAAVKELGDRVADVARDDDVKAQARRTASSFDDALSATVDQISAQVSGLFSRSEKTGTTEGPTEGSQASGQEDEPLR
jgi:hypothetical protein